MESIAKIMDNTESISMMEAGKIIEVKGEIFSVITSFGYFKAKKAETCLITPMKGDKVLLYADGTEPAYILAILERSKESFSPREVAFEGSVEIVSKKGNLNIRSMENIKILSSNEVLISSEDFNLSARRGNFLLNHFKFLGNIFEAKVQKIKAMADSVDSIFKRMVQRLKSSYRYITGHEEVQAKSMRTLVDEAMIVQTKNTIHRAKENIKIDASQIHMG
ncbi:Protein of unknown function [Desulfonauticus submarinus]|uniref:DUF3540 domain-containing protein n=1 Tax=Desulfonauticus submarinus TaxID=206665 RepID=A0A1G9ZTW9_9BACT|nr:DUF3540 domain-containing protein [Desulfonauticus submarinus]SDN25082.1 Protein of unknown function [Desulfonauticus submarinus]